MALPSSAAIPVMPVLLASILGLLMPAAGQTCPPKYCSYCSSEVAYCSGLSYQIPSDTILNDILKNLASETNTEFRLQYASLRDLRKTRFGDWLPTLTKLFVINCDIVFINENTFSGLVYLTDVSLHNNSFKNFNFANLSPIKTVQMFDLSSNSITRITNPTKIILSGMQDLNLADNELNFIDDVLEYFPNLHNLVLRNNPLHYFTNDTFKGLDNLLSLDLADTQIFAISDEYFAPLKGLVTLNLDHSINTMKGQFSKWKFHGLDNLKRLILRNNTIQALSDQLHQKSLGNLEYLDLSYNNIIRLENGTFSFLKNLQILKLSNMLSPMLPIPSSTFIGLPKLTYLDLQGNYLTTLPLTAFTTIKFAKISLMNGNHFLCNCSLIPFKGDIVNGLLKTDIQCRINSETIFLSQMTDEDLGCTAPSLNGGINETVVNTNVGSTALILCNASSSEEFPQLTYYAKEGNPIPQNKLLVLMNKTMTILPDERKHFTTVTKIFVRKVDKDNSGLLVCVGNTKYGESESFVTVRVQEQEAAINNWTIGVVTSLVTVLIVIIITAIAITWRRKKNRERRLENERRRQIRRVNGGSSLNETDSLSDNNNTETPAVPQPVISETSL